MPKKTTRTPPAAEKPSKPEPVVEKTEVSEDQESRTLTQPPEVQLTAAGATSLDGFAAQRAMGTLGQSGLTAPTPKGPEKRKPKPGPFTVVTRTYRELRGFCEGTDEECLATLLGDLESSGLKLVSHTVTASGYHLILKR